MEKRRRKWAGAISWRSLISCMPVFGQTFCKNGWPLKAQTSCSISQWCSSPLHLVFVAQNDNSTWVEEYHAQWTSAQWCCVDTICLIPNWETCRRRECLIPSCTGPKDLPRWAEGSHNELSGHVFNLERDGLYQVAPCPWFTMKWQPITRSYWIVCQLGQKDPVHH